MKIELGTKVVDTLTGFRGTAVARTEYLHEAPSVWVLPVSTDGNQPQTVWITESRLAIVTG